MGIAHLYAGWSSMNERIVEVLSALSAEDLKLPVGSPDWPIWASASHIAGARVYWLCHIFGEPGLETTPVAADPAVGWEDDVTHPRGPLELADALTSSWSVVEHCLESWTPDSLGREAQRDRGGIVQLHTRQSVLMRLITHDAYHTGEISLTLGMHGLGPGDPNGPIDLWSRLSRVSTHAAPPGTS